MELTPHQIGARKRWAKIRAKRMAEAGSTEWTEDRKKNHYWTAKMENVIREEIADSDLSSITKNAIIAMLDQANA